jgi:phenylacetic acid degradation operon negative regulatory protein
VVLSTLLGYDPPALPVRALVRVGGLFDIPERTVRVAITRMVADGDLEGDRDAYRLTDRLVRRQRHQRDACSPRTKPWAGDWEMAVVTTGARPLAERVRLRRSMVELRLAELREGVWVRPANLARDPDEVADDQCAFFEAVPREPATELVHSLWDLPTWATEAARLLDKLEEADSLVAGFLATAEVIRHLLVDPVLPDELLPRDWPGGALRETYATFNEAYSARLRQYSEA